MRLTAWGGSPKWTQPPLLRVVVRVDRVGPALDGALDGAERAAGARVGAREGAERVAGARAGARDGADRVAGARARPLRAVDPLEGAGCAAWTLLEGAGCVACPLLEGADRVAGVLEGAERPAGALIDGVERVTGALADGVDRVVGARPWGVPRVTGALAEGALRAVDPRFAPGLLVVRSEGRLALGIDRVPPRADGVLAARVPEARVREVGVRDADAPTAGLRPPRTQSDGRAAELGVREGAPTRDWGCRTEGVPLAPAVGEVLPTREGVALSATPTLGVPWPPRVAVRSAGRVGVCTALPAPLGATAGAVRVDWPRGLALATSVPLLADSLYRVP